MSTTLFPRPVAGDCADYYFKYINQVPEVDILTYLHTQRDWYGDFIEQLTPELAQHRYAQDKWSLAEMIGHIMDTERVFAYRMLAISRDDHNHLPGFDQDVYVSHSIYHDIPPAELAQDWRSVRSSTIYLARHMNPEMAARLGTANNQPVRASSFPYIMAGHVLHHYAVARDRYLKI